MVFWKLFQRENIIYIKYVRVIIFLCSCIYVFRYTFYRDILFQLDI